MRSSRMFVDAVSWRRLTRPLLPGGLDLQRLEVALESDERSILASFTEEYGELAVFDRPFDPPHVRRRDMTNIVDADVVMRRPEERHIVENGLCLTQQQSCQMLARLLLGQTKAVFNDVPFFWSTHHDIGIHYVGHVATPNVRRIEGSIEDGEFAIFLREGGEDRALVTLERDLQSLEIEATWEQEP